MKTGMLTLILVSVPLAAFPQGKVTFGNDSTRLFVSGPIWPWQTGPLSEGPLPDGRIIQATLYAGTSANSLTLQTAVGLVGSNWLSPGRMTSQQVVLSGVPGGVPAYFQICLADDGGILPAAIIGDRFPTSEFQASGGAYFGTSGLFTAVPGTSIAFPSLTVTSPPVNSTWQPGNIAIYVAPEPSTLTLVSTGSLVTLFCRYRRWTAT